MQNFTILANSNETCWFDVVLIEVVRFCSFPSAFSRKCTLSLNVVHVPGQTCKSEHFAIPFRQSSRRRTSTRSSLFTQFSIRLHFAARCPLCGRCVFGVFLFLCHFVAATGGDTSTVRVPFAASLQCSIARVVRRLSLRCVCVFVDAFSDSPLCARCVFGGAASC